MAAASVEAGAARCAYHPDRGAAGICDRCGSYYCAGCVKQLGEKRLCSGCLALPGIDYLAEARAKAWGKRDGWVWYLGCLGGFGSTTTAIAELAMGHVLRGLLVAGEAALLVSYFFLVPFSRKGLFAIIPLAIASSALNARVPNTAASRVVLAPAPVLAGVALASALIFGLFIVAAYRSTRNKLAFKLEVSDAELAKYYDKYLSNPDAQRALAYGVLSVLVPVLVPVALVFGLRGLRRSKPDAWPPVRHRGFAFAGLASAGLSTLLWVGVIALVALRAR